MFVLRMLSERADYIGIVYRLFKRAVGSILRFPAVSE
jgi:hypothetical protein